MAKLLEVDLKVQLPKGSTYADVRVEFEDEGYYAASTAVGGDLIGKTTAPDADGMAVVKGPDGVAALKVYGGEVGDDMPPLVSLRIIPRGAGIRAVPWAHKGHPRDTGNSKWNGSKFGTKPGERISTEAERVALEQRIAAADAATGELAAKKAEVDQALADTAQTQAQMQAQRDAYLIAWAEAGAYTTTSVTRNADEVVDTAQIKWPDGSAGVYTGTNYNATNLTFDGYTLTHTVSSRKITQPAVTRNAYGDITAQPALTIGAMP